MLKKNIIISITLLLLLWPQKSWGDPTDLLRILSLRIDPQDNSATIIWSTNYETTGRIDFGLTNALGSWINDTRLGQYHETVLNGLIPKQTYYFKLRATTVDDRTVVSDIYNFESEDENDTTAPSVTEVHTSFVTGNSATFVWLTNEAADSCVYYGDNISDLNHKKCNGSRITVHDLTITGLQKNHLYYYNVASKDKSGNSQHSVYYNFRTSPQNDDPVPDLIIYELTPFNSVYSEDSASVKILVRANRPFEGYIRYGTKPGKYSKKVDFDRPRKSEQEKTLENLDFATNYYYKLYLKDVLNKTLNSPEYTFVTLPENVLTGQGNTNLPSEEFFNINDPAQDFDLDGLTNAQEEGYNTDPINKDTDGDGYIDGLEVVHGYNPNGPGRISTPPQTNFAYGQTRLSSLAAEKELALELQRNLEELFAGPIPIAKNNWPTLVNAYIYGGYPLPAIYKSIIFGGKTAHPTIPWTAWKNSADYLEYINK